ncbi:MAG: hypothetical protein RLZZ142_1946, partial [Verrucomicrobiota bacterium]
PPILLCLPPLPQSGTLAVNPLQPQLRSPETRSSFGAADALILLGLLGLLGGLLHFGSGMLVRFDGQTSPPLDPSPLQIPTYAGRTLLRMWIAYGCSLVFSLALGYLAAKSLRARALILPALDVLQSIPVFGFLSASLSGFLALFPGSLLGLECASIFAIFTGQVWNMTFGFYHSLISIPNDLQEAATAYRLSRWQRFFSLELPASLHSLLWNSMLSFGGGWFFVVQSEAISVLNRDFKLPGLGSYMALALERADPSAAAWSIAAMLAVILLSDQLVWRPLLAWADRFKLELTASSHPPTSWLYSLLRGAFLFSWIHTRLLTPLSDALHRLASSPPHPARQTRPSKRSLPLLLLLKTTAGMAGAFLLWKLFRIFFASAILVHEHVSPAQWRHLLWLGILTLLRVLLMTSLASLLWIPVGVWIGLRPSVARFAQPLAQIAASFPVNMTFPWIVGFFVSHHISMNAGCILLIAMGTQWYILFNVIAGAMALPNDLQEAARSFRLRGWNLWKTLILPAIFPYWITGACTAAGGAWNASVTAEIASWGNTVLRADGLGAFIAEVTRRGDIPLILSGIATMSTLVILMNHFLWRRLYALAERRFHLD